MVNRSEPDLPNLVPCQTFLLCGNSEPFLSLKIEAALCNSRLLDPCLDQMCLHDSPRILQDLFDVLSACLPWNTASLLGTIRLFKFTLFDVLERIRVDIVIPVV